MVDGQVELPAAAESCPTCGASRVGRYCPRCGEKFLEPDELSFSHFFRKHVMHEFIEVDGRIGRGLWSLFVKPGALAKDFVAGRRQRFSSPLRIYLVIYLLHAFLDAVFFHNSVTLPERAKLFDRGNLLGRLIASRSGVDWSSEVLQARLAERTHWTGEFGTFLIFVGLAGVQACVFYKLRRTYVEHLALALSVCAWFLSMLTLGDIVLVAFWHAPDFYTQVAAQSWIALLGLPVYWAVSIRRFYGLGWPICALTGVLMTVSTAYVAKFLNALLIALLVITA